MPTPLVQVEQLTRRFGGTVAVDGLSFSIEKGEIVGFLGPNGAGKTTTLRMLCSFLPPSSGRAAIAGHDVFSESLEVRRRVGYLPEAVPLYPELRVSEYLGFRSRIKEIPRRNRAGCIDSAIERCGLGEVRRRIVGQLSRGYRQRLGLADALLHDPPILILDEPTVGLDPNQVRQARELVRGLGEDHTVFLSTHILPEVEALCSRVLILHRGRLAAEGDPQTLKARLERGTAVLEVEIRGPASEVAEALEALDGVASLRAPASPAAGEPGRFLVEAAPERDLREPIFRLCVARDWVLLGLTTRGSTLEDLFVDLTTREPAAPGEHSADGPQAGGEATAGDAPTGGPT